MPICCLPRHQDGVLGCDHHKIVDTFERNQRPVAEEVPLLAVKRTVDHVTGIRHRGSEIRIIFNDEQAQADLRRIVPR